MDRRALKAVRKANTVPWPGEGRLPQLQQEEEESFPGETVPATLGLLQYVGHVNTPQEYEETGPTEIEPRTEFFDLAAQDSDADVIPTMSAAAELVDGLQPNGDEEMGGEGTASREDQDRSRSERMKSLLLTKVKLLDQVWSCSMKDYTLVAGSLQSESIKILKLQRILRKYIRLFLFVFLILT